MDDRSSDFRDALVELIEGSPSPAEHPSPDRWIAYHRGELPPEEEALLQEHLARCPDCFDLAAGAAEFAKPDDEPGGGRDVETTALWRLLRPQLDPPPAPPGNVRPISAAAPRPPSRSSRLPTTLAATFFVATVGMSALYLQQRSALLAPVANVATLEIRGGERAGEPELTMPSGQRMLRLHPAEDLPAWRLTIRDAVTGREVVSEKLLRDENLAFNLYLPKGLLPPGRYRLELADSAGKVRETHTLRVAEPGRGE